MPNKVQFHPIYEKICKDFIKDYQYKIKLSAGRWLGVGMNLLVAWDETPLAETISIVARAALSNITTSEVDEATRAIAALGWLIFPETGVIPPSYYATPFGGLIGKATIQLLGDSLYSMDEACDILNWNSDKLDMLVRESKIVSYLIACPDNEFLTMFHSAEIEYIQRENLFAGK